MKSAFCNEGSDVGDRIVAEISRNWTGDKEQDYGKALICQLLESVIETNRVRGYNLERWDLSRVAINGVLNETIIAVFVQRRQ